MFRKLFLPIVVVALLLAACRPAGSATPTGVLVTETSDAPRTLTVMSHDSFAISEEALAVFEQANHVTVQFLAAGDTGTALNKAILAKNNPLADVFYGVDNTFLSRALEEGIFEAYDAPALQVIPAEFQLDSQNRALPIDYGDVCLNYDIAALNEAGIPPPGSLEDLLDPAYQGLLVVEDPATSSPGLAFLLATIGHFGEDGFLDFWAGLRANDVKVVDGWETAYYTEFTRAGGTRPIVVSYSSSPAFEVIYADPPVTEPPTAAVVADESCFRQIEFVGILAGTQNRDLAEKWVDFMLSTTFQEDMPLQMFVFPVNPQAQLDEQFTRFLVNPQKTANLAPEVIAANREEWIQAWTETVLR
ncbi:MAG: thiamine ABC transporter substrate-binding protein [Chloroflexota bacterium]